MIIHAIGVRVYRGQPVKVPVKSWKNYPKFRKRRSPRLIIRMQLTLNSAHFVWYTTLRTSLTGLGMIMGGVCDRKLSEVGLGTSKGESKAGVDGE